MRRFGGVPLCLRTRLANELIARDAEICLLVAACEHARYQRLPSGALLFVRAYANCGRTASMKRRIPSVFGKSAKRICMCETPSAAH